MGKSTGKLALKSGIYYTICNFILKAMGFLTMPIFTRIMSKSDVGSYSNFTSWVSILVTIMSFDLYSSVAVARFDYKDELDDYIASVLILGSTITTIFYIIVLFFKGFFLDLFSFSELELHVAFAYFLVCPALQMFQMKSRIQYKYKTSVALSLGSVFLSTLTALLFVFMFTQKSVARILGHYIPLIILNIAIYAYIIIKSKKISKKYWKYALKISVPLVWHALSSHLLSSSDRVMITKMCGSSDTAMYSVAYTCAMVVSILWMSLNTAWSPWAYEKMDEKNFDALKKASKPYIIFFGIVVLGFLLFAPEVLLLMGGKQYSEALAIIPPVMVAYVFQFLYSLYVNIETFSKKQHYIAIGTTIAAILNIVLNLIFIPIFGYVAAAYTTLFGYITLFIVHYLFVFKLKKHNWYDTKFNFSFLGIYLFILLISIVLYNFSLIRYLLIGLIMIIFIVWICIFKNEIIYLVKNKSIIKIKEKLNNIKKNLFKKG